MARCGVCAGGFRRLLADEFQDIESEADVALLFCASGGAVLVMDGTPHELVAGESLLLNRQSDKSTMHMRCAPKPTGHWLLAEIMFT